MKTFQEFIFEAKKCWPGYKKKGTQKLFGKTYNRCVKEDIDELEESSMGERSGRRTRGKVSLARGRGADMDRGERSHAAAARKAGMKGTGKYSTKDFEAGDEHTTYNPDDDDTAMSHDVRSYKSRRGAATPDNEGISLKTQRIGIGRKKVIPSNENVRKLKHFNRDLTKSGSDKRGRVHVVDIFPQNLDIEKNDKTKLVSRGKNFIKAVKDVKKVVKNAGAKRGEGIVGKPAAMMPGEDKKTGEEKRGKLYKKIFGKSSTKKSNVTGYVSGKVDESFELEESSMGERSGRRTRGKLTLARGRGADMNRRERTTAAIAKKAGLKGTGKYSTKDLRSKSGEYTTYDSEDDLDDIGSKAQDHYITSRSSPRAAAKGEHLIRKFKPAGRDSNGWTKLKSAPSSESVRRVRDLRKQITKAGGDKRGKVHSVSILNRDTNVGKNDKRGRMERGRNFIQALKDTPKHLKAAGAKKGETVVGKPTAVMPGEDKKTGEEKRAKLYKKAFGKRTSERSPKTGLMTGKID